MKLSFDPLEIADYSWEHTHEKNVSGMASDILAMIDQLEPPPADSTRFLALVMELSWKIGFATALGYVAQGAIHRVAVSTDPGKN